MPNQAHRKKNYAGRFRLFPQPYGALQNYSILGPGYRCVRFLDIARLCHIGHGFLKFSLILLNSE